MGPPGVQGVPAVPRMGVRVFMSHQPQRRGSQPPSAPPDRLVQSFLSGPPQSDNLLKSPDLQTRSETRSPLCDLLSQSPKCLMRMKRSSSEVMISDIGAEDLDAAAINLNTGASLKRGYGSTTTVDQPSSPGFMETVMVEEQPSAQPPHLSTSLSPSLQTATQIAQGDIICIPGYNHMDPSVFYCRGSEQVHVQRDKPEKMETQLFSRLQRQRNHQKRSSRVSTSQKCFSHYDVQSIFFNIIEPSGHQAKKNTCTGTLVAPQQQGAARSGLQRPRSGCDDLNIDYGDGKSSCLIHSCPFFRNEIGGETERKLCLMQTNTCNPICRDAAGGSCRKSLYHCSNNSVSVLEGCRENQVFTQNLMKKYDIENMDLGARYYLKYFYNRSKT